MATISPAQNASFCTGKNVVLTANAGNNLSYQWYRDATIISGATSQTYTATTAGTYQVKVSGPTGGCTATFSEETVVTESSLPDIPTFTFSPLTYECSGTPITFKVTNPINGLTYAWDFGDGTTETGNNVTHPFYANNLTDQDFNVKLKAINENGCTSATTSKTVRVKAGPVIKLTNPKDFRNCNGGTFNMQVSDQSDVTGEATYKIDWGDKSPIYTSETAPIAVAHNYAAGVYNLKYSIVSPDGCSVNRSYTVYNITNPAMSVNSSGNTIGCGPLTVTFPITQGASNDTSTIYTVDFGDGSPNVIYKHKNLPSSVTHTYVKSSCGSPGTPPFFPSDAYVFKITASNGCGSTPAAVGGIRVYTKSQASFNVPFNTACINTPVLFKNTTSEGQNSTCNTTTSYLWDFGDGTKSTKENPIHTYNAAGVYTVTLTAENSCSATSVTKEITVIAPPKAIFTTNVIPTSACVAATVQTTNNSTGDNLKYAWSVRPALGYTLTGGSTLTSENPGFVFNTVGTYRITLNTYNACITDTTSRKIVFKGKPAVSLPTAKKYCGPQTIAFSAENTKHTPVYTLNNSTGVSYLWSVDKPITFENGTTPTSQYPAIKFDTPGTYTVSATITSECGSSQTATQVITIEPTPDSPVVADVTICQDTKATFTASKIAGTYKWFDSAIATKEIGTGTSFTTETLKTDKTYFVSFTSETGCVSQRVAVKVLVTSPVTNNTITGAQLFCEGGTVKTLSGSQPTGGNNDYSFRWEVSTNGTLFTEITGATSIDYLPEKPTQTTWYRRKVLSGSCTAVSTPVQIEVQKAIANNIISGEQDQVICAGTQPGILTGTVPTGGNNSYSYAWEISLDNITFTTAPGDNDDKDYTPGILNNTTWFRRKVTGGICTASVSEVIKITVNPTVANNNITSKPENTCIGTVPAPLIGSTPTGGNNNYTYIWEVSTTSATAGFTAAPSENTNKDYESGPLTQDTWFRRKVTSGSCTEVSAAALIRVNQNINNNLIISTPKEVCIDAPISKITATNPAGGNGTYTYEWQVSTTGPNVGFETAPGSANLKEYTPSHLKVTSWFRRVVISAPCQSDISPAVKIDVLDPIANNIISGGQIICAGSKPTGLTGTQPTGSTGEYSFLWEVSTTSATSGFGDAPGINNGENYAPGTLNRTSWFRRKVIAANCDQHISGVVEITVTPTIVNTLTSKNQIICTGTAATSIIGDAPSGGNNAFVIVWESSIDNINFEAADGNNTENNYNPGVLSQNMWFRRKISSGACESYSTIIEITVNPLITKNTIDGAQDLCATSTPEVILGSSPAGGNGKYTYLWESSTDNINFSAAKSINNTRDYQPGEVIQTTWFRRRVMAGSCEPTLSDPVKISVTPGVSTNTIGSAQRICIGTTAAPLIGNTAAGGNGQITYLWEVSTIGSAQGFIPASGINNGKDYQPSNLTQTSWFRRMIISGGCSSISRTVQITVDVEIGNNTISEAQTICTQNAPKTLTGSQPTGGNTEYIYEWEMSTDGINYTAASGENEGINYTPPVLTKSTWYRRVILSAPCAASESNPVLIKVLPVIMANTIENNQEICSGNTPVVITGSKPTGSTGQYIYLWESSTNLAQGFVEAAGVNNQATYSPPALTKTTWYRRVVIASPCQQLISNVVKVQVNELPLAPTVQDITICKGSQALLTANGLADSFEWFTSKDATTPIFAGKTFQTPEIEKSTTYYVQIRLNGCTGPRVPINVAIYETVANAGNDVTIVKGQTTVLNPSGGVSYKWMAKTKGESMPVTNFIVSPEETTTYILTAITADGCTSKDEVTITVIPKIITTNGITPNGDGVNDTWAIKNIEFYPEAQIEIFNRWGSKIYSAIGYNTPWDGKFNGQQLPVAAYYYIIKLSKDDKPITGSITLIR